MIYSNNNPKNISSDKIYFSGLFSKFIFNFSYMEKALENADTLHIQYHSHCIYDSSGSDLTSVFTSTVTAMAAHDRDDENSEK